MEELLSYDFRNSEVQAAKKYKPDPKCNSIMITNIGNTVCFVNGFPLNPGTPGTNNGEAFSVPGNRMEVYKPSNNFLDITFTTGAGSAVITEKYYTK